MSKEMWFRHYERIYNENMDRPKARQKTEDQLADEATNALRNQLTDIADNERKAAGLTVTEPTVCACCQYVPSDARYRPWWEWGCQHESAKLGAWFNPVTGQTVADPPRVKCKAKNNSGACPDWKEGKNVLSMKITQKET